MWVRFHVSNVLGGARPLKVSMSKGAVEGWQGPAPRAGGGGEGLGAGGTSAAHEAHFLVGTGSAKQDTRESPTLATLEPALLAEWPSWSATFMSCPRLLSKALSRTRPACVSFIITKRNKHDLSESKKQTAPCKRCLLGCQVTGLGHCPLGPSGPPGPRPVGHFSLPI